MPLTFYYANASYPRLCTSIADSAKVLSRAHLSGAVGKRRLSTHDQTRAAAAKFGTEVLHMLRISGECNGKFAVWAWK